MGDFRMIARQIDGRIYVEEAGDLLGLEAAAVLEVRYEALTSSEGSTPSEEGGRGATRRMHRIICCSTCR